MHIIYIYICVCVCVCVCVCFVCVRVCVYLYACVHKIVFLYLHIVDVFMYLIGLFSLSNGISIRVDYFNAKNIIVERI